ncbi:hypothetical protein K470DRAFT_258161 [Piedraia hortae CBS 480.64]|uniref:Zn(2)-C6 fungal-type domain-containing protein n=1 Tax=Piedraia hortae CBS 480.64 TaxID=1314780 RepID=A0A6A7BZU5_9PEZI|nr:hypothetical protein K470DRAFT_258161 [Piedraia hortae CBS 480.64]
MPRCRALPTPSGAPTASARPRPSSPPLRPAPHLPVYPQHFCRRFRSTPLSPPQPLILSPTPIVIMSATAEKRKRSPSATSAATPPSKASRTGASSIDYLSRHSTDDLPLVSKDDSLPSILRHLSSYGTVLDARESLASNLGIRPLAPILIQRFERCFDAPPEIVASHHRESSNNCSPHSISWLEVLEFARAHPSQFVLGAYADNRRVCQFYYPQKQLRVQVNEDDFMFINSGRCQELIPPRPIREDEEKELAVCEELEARLREMTNLADMASACAHQLSHRLKSRRSAIQARQGSPGHALPGFVAVNSPNGGDAASASALRRDLVRHLESLPHNQRRMHRVHEADTRPRCSAASDGIDVPIRNSSSSMSPVPVKAQVSVESANGTNAPKVNGARLKHNFSRPLPQALESAQPFRPLCQAHMDSLPRGYRVIPPCDRCRRLRMDCVKNLTSCAGCTKKHARCHWKDVQQDELGEIDGIVRQTANGASDGASEVDSDEGNPLEDLEALAERVKQESSQVATNAAASVPEPAKLPIAGDQVKRKSPPSPSALLGFHAVNRPQADTNIWIT